MLAFRAAILCGGAGTRLWPLSRDHAPKQFHPLVGNQSLLSETIARAQRLSGMGWPLIVTAEGFADTVAEHARLAGVDKAVILLEPVPRNTAPAAALAALAASEDDPKTVIALLPSDHHIADDDAFQAAMRDAYALASSGHIVTLGIVPSDPNTGYGYIRRGEAIEQGYLVDRFIEKPDAETAAKLFAAKDYYWNAGIFIFRADVFLAELERFQPEIADATRKAWAGAHRGEAGAVAERAAWADCPSESIDYAVAEKTALAAVVPVEMGWNDVGSWASLMELAERDGDGNAVFGDATTIGSGGCYVRSTSRHISVIGATDLIVVETADAVLIVHKDAAQQVKHAAEAFKQSLAVAGE